VIAPSYPIPAGAKLPVIDAAYGGPGVTIVAPNVLSYARSQWIADAVDAYVVAIDSAGTPGRGRDFERRIAGAFGTTPLDGHIATLRALEAQRPPELAAADFGRVGVFGWSFGGYFSALAALGEPRFYRVAVAGAPPADWRDYDTAYTERYLGVPGDAAAEESYKKSNLLVRASEASQTSPLLLIHGTADDNVYFSQSLKLAQAMEQRGLPVEFYPIAGTTHLLVDPDETVRVWTRVAQFLKAGLVPAVDR
jgi:dipeptidyl-peptidase-4